LGNCNWDYGLGGKGYEMIKIKKLETGRDKCKQVETRGDYETGKWVMGYGLWDRD